MAPLEQRARTTPAEDVPEQTVHATTDDVAQPVCGWWSQYLARARRSREVAQVTEVPRRLAAAAAQGAGAQRRKESVHPSVEAVAEVCVVLEHDRYRVRVVGLRAPLPQAQVRQRAAHSATREKAAREVPLAIWARRQRVRPFLPQHLIECRCGDVGRRVRS